MTHTRRLLSLLLSGALLFPQLARAGAFECEGVASIGGVAMTSAMGHPVPAGNAGCRQHHSGTAPLPAGMQHCAVSLDCASMAALPIARAESREVPAIVTVGVATLHLPTSSSPEPQAPPPRA